jgi:hypothetical protein
MILARGHGDPLLKLIILLAIFVCWLIKSVFGKVEANTKSLPSFPFSELKETPVRPVRIIHTKIRGVSFDNPDGTSRQQIIRNCCHPGDALLLLRDRHNPVDPNAVALVRICRGPDGKATFREQLGYLPRELAQDLSPVFDDGSLGLAEILQVIGDITGKDGYVGVDIRAEIYISDDRRASKYKVPRPTRSYKGEGVA